MAQFVTRKDITVMGKELLDLHLSCVITRVEGGGIATQAPMFHCLFVYHRSAKKNCRRWRKEECIEIMRALLAVSISGMTHC